LRARVIDLMDLTAMILGVEKGKESKWESDE
jgi:hypothetical protein